MSRADLTNIITILLLAFISLSFFSIFIPVYQVSEAREGQLVKEMIETANVISPLRLGTIIPSKPPLFHWISVSTIKTLNEFNTYTLRLTSILSACSLLIFFYFFNKTFLPSSRACFASLFLLTTYGFFNLATDARVDMLFNFFILSAIFIWLNKIFSIKDSCQNLSELKQKDLFLICTLLALSVFTKGPLGLVLGLSLMLVSSCSLFGFRSFLFFFKPIFLLVILIPSLWYFFAFKNYGIGVINKQILFENVHRVMGLNGISIKPFWFYLQHLFTQGFPWIIVLLLSLKISLKSFKDINFKLKTILILFIYILILLSFSLGKRRAYLLTSLPFMITSIFLTLENNKIKLIHINKFIALIPLFLFSIIILNLNSLNLLISKFVKLEIVDLTFIEAMSLTSEYGLYFILISLLISIVHYLLISSYNKSKNINSLLKIGLIFFFQFFIVFLPFFERVKSETHSFERIAKIVSNSIPIKSSLNVVKQDRDESLDVFFLYYDKPFSILRPKEITKDSKGYLLLSSKNYNSLDIKPVIISKLKRASDDEEDTFYLSKF